MKQKRAPRALATSFGRFGDLRAHIFRFRGDDLVFLASVSGEWVDHFPVLENGQVSKTVVPMVHPDKEVDVLDPHSLKMKRRIVWTDDVPE